MINPETIMNKKCGVEPKLDLPIHKSQNDNRSSIQKTKTELHCSVVFKFQNLKDLRVN